MAAERSRPRVLFVIGSLEPGGSEGQLAALLEQVHGERVDAALVTLGPASDDRHERRLRAVALPIRELGGAGPRPVRLARSVRGLVGALRSFRPDLVYPWLEESTLLAAPVARALGLPVLVARRNVDGNYAGRGTAIVAAIHAAERLAVMATANSDAVVAETIRRGVPAERVRLVRNGQAIPAPSALPSGAVVVLGYLARMRPEKGHRRLLRALAAVRTDVRWRIDLAGDGPLQPELEKEVERLGLGDRVRFVGAVADGPAFWRDCDVAVLLSDHEGSPNALIEAALVGRPLVATNVGGVPELMDETMGALVDPDDEIAIAGALRRLIDDPALRVRQGAAARERATGIYTMDAMVEGHCAAIGQALELAGR